MTSSRCASRPDSRRCSTSWRKLRGVRLLPFLLVLAACADPAPPAASAVPQRVVTLLPSWTELLVTLGAGDRIVACTAYCDPGREVERIDWQDPRAAERVARLRPDIVLRQRPRAQRDPFGDARRAVGVRVLELPSETIADVRAAYTRVGVEMGRGDEAGAALAQFDRDLAAVVASVAGRARPRVLFVYTRSPGAVAQVGAAGPGSFIDELIGVAGGVNALADADVAYVNLDIERLLRAESDVIIDNLPPEEDPGALWSARTPTRVRFVHDNKLLIPGPRLPAAAAALVELIHGEP